MVKTAIILVAGVGSRLLPLTETIPKCLAQIKGKPILINTLNNLEKNNIKEAVIVVGHLENVIKTVVGREYHGLKIIYITNDIYKKTNSMYSLWLAREYLKKGALIIEGDSISEENLINKVLSLNSNKSYWVLDKFTEEYEGSMSTSNKENRIIEIEVIKNNKERVKEKLSKSPETRWKSTGIVKITSNYGEKLAYWLDKDVKNGHINIYYDLVIAKHIDESPIYVCDITGMKWFEIDNFEDLKKSEILFDYKQVNNNEV